MKDDLPQESVGDELHRVARAGLSMIPGLGGPAVEFFNRLLAAPIQQRRDTWLNELAERVTKLEQEGRINVDDLQNNDEFVSTVMQASQVAIRNHQQEKLDALRNAVLNTALNAYPDDMRREFFVNMIDRLTTQHLLLLRFFRDPGGWFQLHGKRVPKFNSSSSPYMLLTKYSPPWKEQEALLEPLTKELHEYGLCTLRSVMINMSAEGALQKSTTELGDEFLQFIAEPRGNK